MNIPMTCEEDVHVAKILVASVRANMLVINGTSLAWFRSAAVWKEASMYVAMAPHTKVFQGHKHTSAERYLCVTYRSLLSIMLRGRRRLASSSGI